MAQRGARQVIGIDIREDVLQVVQNRRRGMRAFRILAISRRRRKNLQIWWFPWMPLNTSPTLPRSCVL